MNTNNININSEKIFKTYPKHDGEIFVQINEYGCILSNHGRAFLAGRTRFCKSKMVKGYLRIRTGPKKSSTIARLVAHFFIQPMRISDKIIYLDGNPENCHVSNLLIKKGAGKRFIDITGQKFGKLTVLEQDHDFNHSLSNKSKGWKCLCECGKICSTTIQRLQCGDAKSCGCLFVEKNTIRQGYGEVPNYYWSYVVTNAKIRKFKLNITAKQAHELFIKQNKKCALTGRDIFFGKKHKGKIGKNAGTASLDRIDSSKDYEIDNIQWIHRDVNKMKMNFSQKYFLDTCKEIVQHKLDDEK